MADRTTSPGRRPDARKRAAILAAAQDLFATHGFSATSMDAVARAAATSKLTAYRHFGSKDELFAAAIGARCTDMLAGATQEPSANTVDARSTLIEFGQAFLRLILHPDALAVHQLIIAERDRAPQLGSLFHEAAIVPTQLRLASLLERQKLPVDDPLLAAMDLLALWRSKPMISVEMGLAPLNDDEIAAHIGRAVDLCLAAWAHLAATQAK